MVSERKVTSQSRPKKFLKAQLSLKAKLLFSTLCDAFRQEKCWASKTFFATERNLHVRADSLRDAIKGMERMNNQGKVIPMAGQAG
jgi:hypothetical protein